MNHRAILTLVVLCGLVAVSVSGADAAANDVPPPSEVFGEPAVGSILWIWFPGGPDGYGWRVYDPSEQPPVLLTDLPANSETAWVQEGLEPNTMSTIEVRAYLETGEGVLESEGIIAQLATLLAPPGEGAIDIRTHQQGGFKIDLQRPHNLQVGDTGIYVERSMDAGFADTIVVLNFEKETHTRDYPSTAGDWHYRVTYRNQEGRETTPSPTTIAFQSEDKVDIDADTDNDGTIDTRSGYDPTRGSKEDRDDERKGDQESADAGKVVRVLGTPTAMPELELAEGAMSEADVNTFLGQDVFAQYYAVLWVTSDAARVTALPAEFTLWELVGNGEDPNTATVREVELRDEIQNSSKEAELEYSEGDLDAGNHLYLFQASAISSDKITVEHLTNPNVTDSIRFSSVTLDLDVDAAPNPSGNFGQINDGDEPKEEDPGMLLPLDPSVTGMLAFEFVYEPQNGEEGEFEVARTEGNTDDRKAFDIAHSGGPAPPAKFLTFSSRTKTFDLFTGPPRTTWTVRADEDAAGVAAITLTVEYRIDRHHVIASDTVTIRLIDLDLDIDTNGNGEIEDDADDDEEAAADPDGIEGEDQCHPGQIVWPDSPGTVRVELDGADEATLSVASDKEAETVTIERDGNEVIGPTAGLSGTVTAGDYVIRAVPGKTGEVLVNLKAGMAEDTVRMFVAGVEIRWDTDDPRGQEIPTRIKPNVPAGQEIRLRAVEIPAGLTLSNYEWTIPVVDTDGITTYFSDYAREPLPNTTRNVGEPVNNVDLYAPAVAFFWIDRDPNRTVELTADVDGHPASDQQEFNLEKPTSVVTADADLSRIDVVEHAAGGAALRFGDPGSFATTGFQIEANLTKGIHYGCEMSFLQVVNTSSRTVVFRDPSRPDDVVTRSGLDQVDPYQSYPNPSLPQGATTFSTPARTSDTPEANWEGAGVAAIVGSGSFRMTVLYRPTDADAPMTSWPSHWVPIARRDWSWSGRAVCTVDQNGDEDWDVEDRAASVTRETTDDTPDNATDFPTWTNIVVPE